MLEVTIVAQMTTAAREAREHAYAPYSGFAVGASVLCGDGRVFSGCNVENASYGLSLCAERTALGGAVSAGLVRGQLLAVALIADASPPPAPCGACLQVLAEFAAADCIVISSSLSGDQQLRPLSALLPAAFTLPAP